MAGGDNPSEKKPVDVETGFDDRSAPRRPVKVEEPKAPEPAKPAPRAPGALPKGLNVDALRKLVEQAEAAQKRPVEPPKPSSAQVAAEFQAKAAQSDFAAGGAAAPLASLLGKASAAPPAEAPPPAPSTRFDGNTPAPEVTARDVWKAISAPVHSREGQRSVELYLQVIHQFAVGTNPRYQPDAPEKYRSHIFIWDVTRAMGCEVPHFFGPKELTLGQTVDWIRHEGPMRGWFKTELGNAVAAVDEGKPVLVMPKDIKIKLIGVALPNALAKDGKPLISAAAKKAGNGLTVNEAFGVFAVEWFFHP